MSAIMKNPVAALAVLSASALTSVASAQNFHVVWTYNTGAENNNGSYNTGSLDLLNDTAARRFADHVCPNLFGMNTNPKTDITITDKTGADSIPQANGPNTSTVHFNCADNPLAALPGQGKLIASPAIAAYTRLTSSAGDPAAELTFINGGVGPGELVKTNYDWTVAGAEKFTALANTTPASNPSKNYFTKEFIDLATGETLSNVPGNMPDEVPYRQPTPCGCPTSPQAALDNWKQPSRQQLSKQAYYNSAANRQYTAH